MMARRHFGTLEPLAAPGSMEIGIARIQTRRTNSYRFILYWLHIPAYMVRLMPRRGGEGGKQPYDWVCNAVLNICRFGNMRSQAGPVCMHLPMSICRLNVLCSPPAPAPSRQSPGSYAREFHVVMGVWYAVSRCYPHKCNQCLPIDIWSASMVTTHNPGRN